MEPGHTIYAPRHLKNSGVRAFQCGNFKLYILSAGQTAPSNPDLADASELLETHIKNLFNPETPEVTGFVILHFGSDGTTISINWWVEGCVLCQEVVRRHKNGVDPIPQMRRHVTGCVWELALINHERESWLSFMMGSQQDRTAYLMAFPDIDCI
ncbi:hypothetical protein E1180_01440 [Roseibium denhamense]|uniref:Uncharacterized protein n=1 Tax=Roseibium denhamense TaxID=76305 RepID=A0ABY1PFE0_9HYPH|nr:hypothetical protein [Roseibium denhamense]MTI04180.1 hypothetical protein [Roseibium denhamense]SMP30880.1 hypothetical protein SAMN06265374_3351 [Roseibium denhamense]